jgi:hypothetical protein
VSFYVAEQRRAAADLKRRRRAHGVTAGSIGRVRPAWQRPSAHSDAPPSRIREILLPTEVRSVALKAR